MAKGKKASEEQALVGSVRRAGTFGPSYLVLDVKGENAEILFPESDEKTNLSVQAVMEDPLDD